MKPMLQKPPPISIQDCLKSFDSSAIILTRNNRQAIFLENAWSQQFSNSTLESPPRITPIQTWLEDLWSKLNKASILGASDALCLLNDLIESDKSTDHPNTNSLTKPILNGYGLLMQWCLALQDLELYNQDQNTEVFLHYANTFQKLLEQKNLILTQSIPDRLIQYFYQESTLTQQLPSSIFLYGFVDINPSLEKLFNTLSHHRPTTFIQPQKMEMHHATKAIVYNNKNDELDAMASFAMSHHFTHPKEKIICVVPDLTQNHAHCLEAFLKVNPNALELINISSGESLSQTLLGQSAFNFLNLNAYQTPLKSFLQCIQNPLWCEDSLLMQIEKDRLAHQLYKAKAPTLSLKKWIQHFKADNPLALELVEHLKQWLSIKLNKPKGKQTYHIWLNYFFEELSAIQWPAKQALSSLHYQQYQHLQQVWLSFMELDGLLKPCYYDQALKTLNLLCKEKLFAPESKDRPIHILGALEAHGLACDVLWMCHVDANTWPLQSKPNALLPFKFQKENKMPNACHRYTKQYYDTITQDIIHSAPKVFVSYAQWYDNVAHAPSPLFQQMTFEKSHHPMTSPDQENAYFQKIDDHAGAPLSEKKLPGGSYGLQSQAQCPFQYYARFRLNLSDTIEPSIGLNALERGNIMHDALAYFYQDIKDSKTLQSLSTDHRNDRIQQAIEHCLHAMDKNKFIIDTEKKRLTLLLNQWIDFECQRPFFTILNIESSTQFSIHDFSFTLRIDRIDQLEDHSLLVIDYKSSQHLSSKGWYDDRLTNPQMPLYVLALGDACQSAAFALVKRGEPKFVGISKHEAAIEGVKTMDQDDNPKPWPTLLEQWQTQISNLSFEIKNGFAAVMPDPSSHPCNHCDFSLLCRVHHD
jgi:ATP-dependent helicase/nuclease subunit B